MADTTKILDSRKVVVICDNKDWITDFIQRNLRACSYACEMGFRSDVVVKDHAQLFSEAELIIAVWETQFRTMEGIMEELREMMPSYPFAEKVIALSTNEDFQDTVFQNALGIHKALFLRNRKDYLTSAKKKFCDLLKAGNPLRGIEKAWHNLYKFTAACDMTMPNAAEISKLEDALGKVLNHIGKPNSRYLDLSGVVQYMKGQHEEAVRCWEGAIERDPNFLQPYEHLVTHHMTHGCKETAIALTKKISAINRKGLSSLVSLGSIYEAIGDDPRAEHYYKLALSKDDNLSGAINGLAAVKFRQGHLEQSRALLAKSQQSTRMATDLNRQGIQLVKKGFYEQALGHYSKAQYVLPSHDKGPMLFYNMGLCCSKWGKVDEAQQFLQIALIKDPEYQKARELMDRLPSGLQAA